MAWDLDASNPEQAPSAALELDLPGGTRLVAAPGVPAYGDAATIIVEDTEGTAVCRLDRDQLALLRDWATARLDAIEDGC
jgi:hypothetical protein